MSQVTVVAGDSIHDLREQIFANAAILFPRIVDSHPSFQDTLIIKPGDVFDVVIARLPDCSRRLFGSTAGYQAMLVYGDPLRRKVAAKGDRQVGGTSQALQALLKLLATKVGKEFEAKMKNPKDCGEYGAVYDASLLA